MHGVYVYFLADYICW